MKRSRILFTASPSVIIGDLPVSGNVKSRNTGFQLTWIPPPCGCVLFKAFLGSLVHAACIAQPTRLDFCSAELGDMIQRAGVNKLHTTSARISVHIRDFGHNLNLLHSARRLDEITHYTPLDREDEEWLVQNRIAFSVSSCSFYSSCLLLPDLELVPRRFRSSARMVPLKCP